MRTPAIITAALSFLIAASLSNAQDWQQQSPYPADADIYTVHFVSPDRGFIAGDDDLFMHTTDGGQTWAQVPAMPRDPGFYEDSWWDFEFADDQTGWLFGNGVFRTTNGGDTWDRLPVILGTIDDYRAIDDQIGYAITNVEIFRTTDGGDSFDIIWDDHTVIAADFVTADKGIISWFDIGFPPEEALFETTDAGRTWTRIADRHFDNIMYLDTDTLVATFDAQFFRSTDAGRTWQLVHDATDSSLTNNHMETIEIVGGDTLTAIDIYARIWMSHDAGRSWTMTQNPIANWGTYWDIHFADATTGYAVGRLGMIFKTIDGGNSWAQISNGSTANIRDIVMLPSGVGVAVGDEVVLRTEDFGVHWTALPMDRFTGPARPYHVQFNSLQAVTDDVWVTTGKDDLQTSTPFFRSDDAGQTWTQMGQSDMDTNWEFYKVLFLDEDRGWLFGFWPTVFEDGVLMATSDGGQSWRHVEPLGTFGRITDAHVLPSGKSWAVERQPDVLRRSDDFFEDAQRDTLLPGFRWFQVEFPSDTHGWIAGAFGGLLHTTDGGRTFDDQVMRGFQYDGDDLLGEIHANSPDHAFTVTVRTSGLLTRGIIYETTDGGNGWSPLREIVVPTNTAGGAIGIMHDLPTGEIWAAGSSGFVFTSGLPSGCRADLDGDRELTIFDFLAYQNLFDAGDLAADFDGDGDLTIFDFLAFQNEFDAGCE